MTKADVISEIAQKTGMEKGDVSTAVEAFFKVVKNHMAEGRDIFIRGFGTFKCRLRKAKVARIVARNTTITVSEHIEPTFKACKMFKHRVKDSAEAMRAVKLRAAKRAEKKAKQRK